MQVVIRHNPAYAVAYCALNNNETVRAKSGAMIAMSAGLKVSTDAGPGGVVKGMLRKTLVGQSFFMTRYTAVAHGAWVALAAEFPGDIATIDLSSHTTGVVTESGSLLGFTDGLTADPKWARMTMVASRQGATMTHLQGEGTAIIAAYGGIETFPLAEGQTLIFDTGHVVAFTEGMDVRVGPLHGVVTASFSGEGFVSEIKGPGTVWVQTRAVIDRDRMFLPKKQRRSDRYR